MCVCVCVCVCVCEGWGGSFELIFLVPNLNVKIITDSSACARDVATLSSSHCETLPFSQSSCSLYLRKGCFVSDHIQTIL